MPRHLRLISHKLCPYVQRAVIVATEHGISFERVDIDLANKPDWFLKLSPTGKVPLLEVTEADGSVHILFESAVIAEYLDEISGQPLLPADPLVRARQRAFVELASATLGDIGRLYSAPTKAEFDAARTWLDRRFGTLETEVAGPWFGGEQFGLVDAAFGPAFRYLDVFEARIGTPLVQLAPTVADWRAALAGRPSVKTAVSADYSDRLVSFVATRKSHLASLLEQPSLRAA